MIIDYLKETPAKMLAMITNEDQLFGEVAQALVDDNLQKIIITGSGTSYHGGVCAKAFLEKVTGLQVEVLYPFLINENTFNDRLNTLLIGISQDGGSYSTYNAMKLAQSQKAKTLSMAGYPGVFIDTVANYVATVPCGEEKAGAKTKGFHCTILNLMLLGLQIGQKRNTITPAKKAELLARLKKTISNMPDIITNSIVWVETIKEDFVNASEVRLIGSKELYGTVLEGALKLLETIRVPVSGYEAEEFVHGIYNAINSKSFLIILDSNHQSDKLMQLAQVLHDYTNNIYAVGANVAINENNFHFDFVNDPDFAIFEYVIPVEIMCAIVPQEKGIDPATPMDPKFHQKMGSKKF
ncbi:MAG: SIS domain-containing protein [Bacteroidales bacterium]|nr:SIS domain-containing protein [Bacteroidales bacterium]